jgi:hypothetical protein
MNTRKPILPLDLIFAEAHFQGLEEGADLLRLREELDRQPWRARQASWASFVGGLADLGLSLEQARRRLIQEGWSHPRHGWEQEWSRF